MAEMDETGMIIPGPDVDTSALLSLGSVETQESGVDVDSRLPMVEIPMDTDKFMEWGNRISESRTRTETKSHEWDILLKAYLPVVSENPQNVKVPAHFRNVHTKSSKLFLRNPELILTPAGPMLDTVVDPATGMVFDNASVVAVKQQVLKNKLGRKGADAPRTMGELLFDVLAWAGIGCCKIGYRNVSKEVEKPVMGPDPNYVPPPSVLGLSTPPAPMVPQTDPVTGVPMTQKVPVVIWEDWYMTRFSPKKLLLPANLTTNRLKTSAPFIGMDFVMPEAQARQQFGIPDTVELSGQTGKDEQVYQHADAGAAAPSKMVKGSEIWYKPALTGDDPNAIHPLLIRQLVVIDGHKDGPVVHRNCKDQTFTPEGMLTPDSIDSFPIKVMYIRDLADSPFTPADSAFTDPQVRGISTHREQSVKMRDANIGKFLVDEDAFDPDQVERIKNGTAGEILMVRGGKLAQGADKLVAPVTKNEPARDDWRLSQALKQDMEETLGLGGPQVGAAEDTVRTATEISTVESKSAERMEHERDRVIDFYLECVEMFDTLLMRYADEWDWVEIVGKDGAKKMARWNKSIISAKWAYDAKPDSQLRVDVARDRNQLGQTLEIMAPFIAAGIVNPIPFVKRLATISGVDPSEVIAVPSPAAPLGGSPAPGPSGGPVHEGMTGRLPNAPDPGTGTPQIQNRAAR